MLGRYSRGPRERFTYDAPPADPVDQPERNWRTPPPAAVPPQAPARIPDLVVRIPDRLTGHQVLRDLTQAVSRFRAEVSQMHGAAATEPVRDALAHVIRRFDTQLVDTFGLAAEYGTWPNLVDGTRDHQ